ncbi:hypothetical protein U9R90_29320 [Streptomyces sp. E11-3]|uniref:hypothetical protein n=1 Tax=Streptomyces sp. E11-3 TaxID=3110112 RepID=UPI0039811EE2
MKLRLLSALTLTLGVLAVPQVPAVAAAACTWQVSDLPAPSGYSHPEATGHAGTGRVVGTVWKTDHREGVVWTNGSPQVLPQPRATGGSNYPRAVNSSGVVTGYWAGSDGYTAAWRYQNGAYQFLPGIGTQVSVPTTINDNGDIAGFSRHFLGGAKVYAVLWRTDRPGEITNFGEGSAAGVDNSRRVMLSTGVLVDADGSEVMRLQGDGRPKEYQDGRIVGWSGSAKPYTIVEWNLSGQVVRKIPGGVPSGINSAGAIVGTHDNGNAAVWRDGGVEYVTSPAPTGDYVRDITEDNAVVSTYKKDGTTRSGIWRSTC